MNAILTTVTDTDQLRAIWHELLVPHFPADELEPLDVFLADAAAPGSTVLTLRDDDGIDQAVAVGRHHQSAGVVLLDYLAVRHGSRGGGFGRILLSAALETWTREFSPDFILGEVERPSSRGQVIVEHGDPQARLRFYRRFEARVIAVPYFQPGIGADSTRVPMDLMMLTSSDRVRVGEPTEGHLRVKTAGLHQFIREYLTAAEGSVGDDPQTTALLGALAGETVDTVAL